jgi:hypothetical protein
VVPWHERGAPLRPALHRWAALAGRHFVHAAAVATEAGGVLLAGPSGSGKSTTALACLEAGLDYAGDDYVILEGRQAHCLYSTAKLDLGALERLPGLAPAVTDLRRGREDKAVLDVHAHRADRVRSPLPVDAIVIPTVGGSGPPRTRPASPGEALRALAPTTLIQLPGAAHERMQAMAKLVRRVPAYRVELGDDVAAVAGEIARICTEAGQSKGSEER